MALRSGLAAQVGFKAESSWGTGVTVDRFLPFISETFKASKGRLEADSIYAGRLVRDSEQWDEGAIEAGGDLNFDVFAFGQGLIWKHLIGAAAVVGAGPYTTTYNPTNLDGLGMTFQIGKPDRGGTVRPWNFIGCKAKSWELSCEAGAAARLKTTWSAKDLDKDGTPALQAFAPPAALQRLKWSHATVASVHGVSPKVKSITFKGENGIEDDRLFLGSATIDEQDEVELRQYGGEVEVEFANETLFDAFWNAAEADVLLTLARGAHSLAMGGNARLDGDAPVVENRGKLTQKIPFVHVGDGADADGFAVQTINTDSTP